MSTPKWIQPSTPTVHRVRPATAPNIQDFRINYDQGAYIVVSIDVNNYSDFYYVPDYPGYSGGSTGGFTAPSWLTACNIYASDGTLL
jgi:hypothetical protein